MLSRGTVSERWSQSIPNTVIRLVVVSVLLFGMAGFRPPLPVQAAPAYGLLQNIGDFLSLGANTMRELQKAIELASSEMKSILIQVQSMINETMNMLEVKFQNNLNYSLSSLDAATWNILQQLQSEINTVNELIRSDIKLVSQEAQNTIRLMSIEMRRTIDNLQRALRETLIAVGATGAYLIDRATNNIILIVAAVMLGVGLLVFIWLLYTRRVPVGARRRLIIAFSVVFLVFFGSLLVPQIRVLAMTYTGVGIEERLEEVTPGPRIIDAIPVAIQLGETKEVDVWGSDLTPEGKVLSATIAGVVTPVKAAEEQRVVLDVTKLQAVDGSTSLKLLYDGTDGPGVIVTIVNPAVQRAPAELVIDSLTLDPAKPVVLDNTNASVFVCNKGESDAPSFVVLWKPTADHPGLTYRLTELRTGFCEEVAYNFAYPRTGTFDTVVVADPYNDVREGNESNNSLTLSIAVGTSAPSGGGQAGPTGTVPGQQCTAGQKCCKRSLTTGECVLCIPRQANCSTAGVP